MAIERLSQLLTDQDLKVFVQSIETDLAPSREQMAKFEKIFGTAQQVVNYMSSEPSNVEQGRTGVVVLVVMDGEKPQAMIKEIGAVKPEKIDKYATFAVGKALAVIGNNYLTSQNNPNAGERQLYWTSPDGDIVPFPGGALRIDNYIIGISGYQTEKEDEAAVLATVVNTGILTPERALGLARNLGLSAFFGSGENAFTIPTTA